METPDGLRPLRLSEEFNYALERMEAGAHLFITGRAGTGKSTLLQIFVGVRRKTWSSWPPRGLPP
jgi:ATP-dependent DNA helicase PIF1